MQLTGIPAGRNRSKLCTGIMKQSRSNVDNEIGSVRAPTTILLPCPLKLTVAERNRNGNKDDMHYAYITKIAMNTTLTSFRPTNTIRTDSKEK